MKENELRVGNWIQLFRRPEDDSMSVMRAMDISLVDGVYYTELEDGFMVNVRDGIEPIIIDDVYLRAFGFYRTDICHRDESISRGVFKNYPIIVERNKLDEGETPFTVSRVVPSSSNEYNFIALIKYVHQLQNIYFALTGEELTITTKTAE